MISPCEKNSKNRKQRNCEKPFPRNRSFLVLFMMENLCFCYKKIKPEYKRITITNKITQIYVIHKKIHTENEKALKVINKKHVLLAIKKKCCKKQEIKNRLHHWVYI